MWELDQFTFIPTTIIILVPKFIPEKYRWVKYGQLKLYRKTSIFHVIQGRRVQNMTLLAIPNIHRLYNHNYEKQIDISTQVSLSKVQKNVFVVWYFKFLVGRIEISNTCHADTITKSTIIEDMRKILNH